MSSGGYYSAFASGCWSMKVCAMQTCYLDFLLSFLCFVLLIFVCFRHGEKTFVSLLCSFSLLNMNSLYAKKYVCFG